MQVYCIKVTYTNIEIPLLFGNSYTGTNHLYTPVTASTLEGLHHFDYMDIVKEVQLSSIDKPQASKYGFVGLKW